MTAKKIELTEHTWNLNISLDAPIKRRKPTTYFVTSMGDIFHPGVSVEYIDRIMAVIALCQRHRFIVLTKQPKRMREYFDAPNIYISGENKCDGIIKLPLANLILGVSVHDQQSADEFIPYLLATPAACRAVSYEPALGPVNFQQYISRCPICSAQRNHPHDFACIGAPRTTAGLDWLIAGGEIGPGARPAHPQWFRQARDQCAAAGVAFFFKQLGEWCLCVRCSGTGLDLFQSPLIMTDLACDDCGGQKYLRIGNKRAGRLLDGREHNERPEMLR